MKRTPFLLCLCVLACKKAPDADPVAEQDPPPSNRIAVPEAVRRNLGITFAKVERRRVTSTLRVPGDFELMPSAHREYRTPLAGRVELAVRSLQAVKQGELLYRLDAPEWRTMQKELGELTVAIANTARRQIVVRELLEAHQLHEQSLRESITLTQERVESLRATQREVGGQATEMSAARVQLAQMMAQLVEAQEKHAEATANLAELATALVSTQDRRQLALESAATMIGVKPEQLAVETGDGEARRPLWRTLPSIEVRAAADGVVESLPVATGGWVDQGGLVLATANVAEIRFRGRGLQGDLHLLHDGLPCQLVPPQGALSLGERIPGKLEIGLRADPAQRTIDLFVRPESLAKWTRPGVSAYLEIQTAGGKEELAIPLSAVLHDGLQRVFFRRDPADADKVIRVDGDLGIDDGRWIEVLSGVKEGDEVVLDGAFELMLASSAQAQKGGHFHADGTWHADHK